MLSNEEKKAIERAEFLIKIDTYIEKKMLTDLLNLIEKQSKEIQRLEAKKYMYNAETGEISQIPIDNNYISKDKIREKIKQNKELLDNCNEGEIREILHNEIRILKEFLEE